MKDPCVLLFLKVPEEGRVKTRLAASLSPRTVVGLYRCFVADILSTLEKTGHAIFLCHDPPDQSDRIRNWLGDRHPLMAQKGNDLGDRMAEAFRECFSLGIERAALIGTDIPDLPGEFIDRAFAGLDDRDVVIGPARDGGYYLIGFRADSFAPEVFEGVSWSAPSVLEQTRRILKNLGIGYRMLPEWKDIDTQADLKALAQNPRSKGNAPNTLAYLSKMGLDWDSFG